MDTERVICRGQTIECAAVLGKAHIPLQMLDAGAHGEGFALHGDTGGIKIFKGVTGGVPDGQNSLPAGDELPAVFTSDLRTAQDTVFRPELLQPGAEADLPAQGEDLFPDALHHAGEHVGADVRLGVIEDRLRSTVFIKSTKDEGNERIVGAGVELPVGKGAGSPLTELDIALGIQNAVGSESLHLLLSRGYFLTPLDHNRPCAGSCQHEGGKHPRRAEAYHQRALRHRGCAPPERNRLPIKGDILALSAPDQGVFIPAHGDGRTERIMDILSTPCIQRTADNPNIPNVLHGDPEFFCAPFRQNIKTLPRKEP